MQLWFVHLGSLDIFYIVKEVEPDIENEHEHCMKMEQRLIQTVITQNYGAQSTIGKVKGVVKMFKRSSTKIIFRKTVLKSNIAKSSFQEL